MTVRDVSQTADFWVEITQCFPQKIHKWRDYVKVAINENK